MVTALPASQFTAESAVARLSTTVANSPSKYLPTAEASHGNRSARLGNTPETEKLYDPDVYGAVRHVNRKETEMNAAVRFATQGLALMAVAGLGLAGQMGGEATASTAIGHFYADNTQGSCSSSAACTIKFSPIPAGERVLITHVACKIGVTGNVTTASLVLFSTGGTSEVPGREDYFPVFTNSTGAVSNFTAAGETEFLAGPGQVPEFRVFADTVGTIAAFCNIAGQRPSPL